MVIAGIVGVVVALALGASVIGIYNSLVQVRNNVDKAFNNIDVLLKQRHDELPKLIDTCKAYMKHERETLEDLTRLREHYEKAEGTEEKVRTENEINKKMSKLSGRWEDYPDLKASSNFLQVQGRVSELENSIADRREFFNDSVNIYNIRIEEFPNLLIAKPLGYARKSFLEIPEEDKQDVQMKFD